MQYEPAPSGATFKTESGQYLLRQLFYEYSTQDRPYAIYTLRPDDFIGPDGKKYLSLRRLYVEMNDESEYLFATTYLGGFVHWKKFLESPWFRDYLSEFREELAAKNSAQALIDLKAAARKGSVPANRYLLERGWVKDPVGRPSKEKIKRQAELLSRESSDIQDDYERIVTEMGLKG